MTEQLAIPDAFTKNPESRVPPAVLKSFVVTALPSDEQLVPVTETVKERVL